MNVLISGDNAKKKYKHITWMPENQQSFEILKATCTDTPILAYTDYTKPFRLNTDVSKTGLGDVLYQQQDDGSF